MVLGAPGDVKGGFRGPRWRLGGFRGPHWRLGGFKGPSVAFRGVSRALGGV